MLSASSIISVGFSLAAMLCWGTSDFTGGFAVRRAPAFLFTTITHLSGASLMIALALLSHSPFPNQRTLGWTLIAGVLAGVSLAIFYRALSTSKMGITTPVVAVLSAGIPTIIGIILEGAPSRITIIGFALAGLGLWLITRPEEGGRPDGLGLALISGIGFAGYFLCIKQAGSGSSLWIAGLSRACSFVLTSAIVLFAGKIPKIARPGIRLAVLAGCVDVTGSALFVRAMQTGRLDTVVVISSLYPAVTVLLAWAVLKEHLTHWKVFGMLATLVAVPMIALR
jgi:drug/metabolite transporter (DMT)-like permease